MLNLFESEYTAVKDFFESNIIDPNHCGVEEPDVIDVASEEDELAGVAATNESVGARYQQRHLALHPSKRIPLAAKLAMGELELFCVSFARVKHEKSLQTGCADQTIWSTMLFSMMSFTAVYYTTISIFQHISEEYTPVLLENKTEIRTEGRPTKNLFVCVFFYY